MKKWIVIVILLVAVVIAGYLYVFRETGDPINENLAEISYTKNELIYENPLMKEDDVSNFVMEGPGTVAFMDDGMQMQSPEEEDSHVYWTDAYLPADFLAEWTVRNLNTDAGLFIVFFCARGKNGEDIFDEELKERKGVFRQYTKGDIDNYHISYYANAKNNSGRELTNLRKNSGFNLVQTGNPGIPIASKEAHRIRLIKMDNHISMYIDDRLVINWVDDETALGEGYIGFRQMKWSNAIYSNMSVWSIE